MNREEEHSNKKVACDEIFVYQRNQLLLALMKLEDLGYSDADVSSFHPVVQKVVIDYMQLLMFTGFEYSDYPRKIDEENK
jgi:hypothetical protein